MSRMPTTKLIEKRCLRFIILAGMKLKQHLRQFAVAFGIWTIVGALDGFYVYGSLKTRGEVAATYGIFKDAFGYHWIWAVATLPVFWFTKQFPFQKKDFFRTLFAHLGFFCVIALCNAATAELFGLWVVKPIIDFHGPRILYRFINDGYGYLWVYSVLVVCWHLGDFYQKYKDRETRATKLQAELATAQLEILKAQIHPHFLFNTLNSISALMQEDVQAADDMLADLSFMLRASLEASVNQEIDLESEIDLLSTYLRIQKRRFEDRLNVKVSVESETLEAKVPCLLLQPFVENSIRHGIAPKARAGKVEISAARKEDWLMLQVGDDGVGFPADFKEGIGVSNTRARLKHLYGENQSIDLTNKKGGGAVVTVKLPFKTDDTITQQGEKHELQDTGSGR
jgi:two-component system, LytTR family, sensor kinase